jgi:hypothetical protein
MNNYDDWAHLVAKKLKGEADVIAAIGKDELDDAAATEAFVRTVLTPFLPENFSVGSGRIIDAFGNRSDHLDVVVYNRNFPRISFRGTQSDYLFESVLAAFSVRAKYIRKTFFESMDACASLARLEPSIDKTALIKLARTNGLKPGPGKSFVHLDPLRTARFALIGRPPAFMFGFTGIKVSLRQLQENIELWIEHRQQEQIDTTMRAFPAVIATQGCFAWRNAAPLALKKRKMLGIGIDDAPIRLIVLQLLYLLNRRLRVTEDPYGLKPNLSTYVSQFSPPVFEGSVGVVDELVSTRKTNDDDLADTESHKSESARDHSPQAAIAESTAQPMRKAAAAAAASAEAPADPANLESAQPENSGVVFDKPSPFASAPIPVPETAEAAEPDPPAAYSPPAPTFASEPIPMQPEDAQAAPAQPENSGVVFNKPSPFASAPIPVPETAEAAKPEPPAAYSPPAPTLGSAPIPMQSEEVQATPAAEPEPPSVPLDLAPIPSAEPKPPIAAVDVIPPKPPVDIDVTDFDLTGETALPDKTGANADLDYDATVVIESNPSLPQITESDNSATADNSTTAFIERVKEQMSNPEPLA